MAIIQILSNQAGTGSAVNSSSFRVNTNEAKGTQGDTIHLQIFGTVGDNATIELHAKASDGSFYTTGDIITGIGVFTIPFSSELIYRLQYTADAATGSLSADVVNGILE